MVYNLPEINELHWGQKILDSFAALKDSADTANSDLATHKSDTANPHAVTKTQVGLGNVDNTSDAAKPVSAATQSALDLKAPVDSPTFTGTVAGVTKSMVGLGSVDNTADVDKPVSTAQQAALNGKVGNGILRKHLSEFGAVGNNATADTAALQAAADYLRSFAVTDPPLMRPVIISGQGLVLDINASIDFTNITLGRGWGLEDINVVASCTGATALDFIGSRFGHLARVRVWGDINNQPDTGILMAATSTFAPCSNFTLDRVTTDGYFTSAGFHLSGAEENNFTDCVFDNRRTPDGGGESWAAIIDGAGYKPITSAYQTPISSRGSFTINKFTRCSFRKPFSTAGPSVFLQDIASMGFDQCYITNGAGSAIVWRLTSFIPYRISFDVQIETTGIDRFIQFTSDAAATREIRDLSIRFGNVFCDQEILASDTLTGLTINRFEMRLPTLATGVSLANGAINSALASILTLRDVDVLVPTAATFPARTAFAAISGKVAGADGSRQVYGTSETDSGVAISYAGVGDSTWSYSAKSSRFKRLGGGAVAIFLRLSATPTFTTANGIIQVSLPITSISGLTQSIAITDFLGFTLPAGCTSLCLEIPAGSTLGTLRASGSGVTTTSLTASNTTSGTLLSFTASGLYLES